MPERKNSILKGGDIMKTAAAAYVRVSTDSQMEYSPDSQIKLIQEYCDKNDIVLLEDYIFIEESGISGKLMDKRPEFMRMISTAKKKPKPFDVILVWKFSRFARNMEEAITLKAMLKRSEIEVISISEPLPEGPFGDLMERILEWQDSYYLVNLSQEVKRGMKEKASRGEPVVSPPIGYSLKDGAYIPDENAAIVQNIFSDYLSGIGMRAIAAKYAALGLKTKRGNAPDNRFIEYILRNPVYIGKIRWSQNGKAASRRNYDDPNILIFDGKHEPIITEEVFNMTQDKIVQTKKRYGRYQRPEQPIEYMLKGLVRCSACEATLIRISTKSPALQCHRYAKGQCHTSHSISVDKANKALSEYLKQTLLTGDFTVNNKSEQLDAPELNYQKMLVNEQQKLERAKQAYQAGVDTLEEYRQAKQKITDKIKQIEKTIKKPPKKTNKAAYKKRIQNVLRIINDSAYSEAQKNAALRTIVEKIIFNKSGNRFDVVFYE